MNRDKKKELSQTIKGQSSSLFITTPPHVSDKNMVVLCRMRPPRWPRTGSKDREPRLQPEELPAASVCASWWSGGPRLSIQMELEPSLGHPKWQCTQEC